MTLPRSFPAGFVWGAATAAYQIEGAANDDGRGRSIWDTFSHTAGTTVNGDTGDVACDHYHRVDADVALMAELGLPSYRFSVAWPRVLPTGAGTVNQAGLDFYARLVDTLLAHDIEPLATLYHWDLPQPLQDAGGWTARDTALRFAEYAELVGRALGDRVPTITTLNEPWCSAYLGHASGVHAPGWRDDAAAYAAVHHLNLAHGLGAAALRSILPTGARISLTLNLAAVRPASSSPEDADAARHVDGIANRMFLDPVFKGSYPRDVLDDLRQVTDFAFVQDGDLAAISTPLDVLGVNYYTPTVVAAARPELGAQTGWRSPNDPSAYPGTSQAVALPQPGPRTAMGWTIDPSGLSDLLVRVSRDLPGVPLMITENGAAFDDVVAADGRVHDDDRIAYLRGHLGAVLDAIEQGVDVRGYYVWSLLDNFEWALGYTKRFGIVRVDYDTQQRLVKDSARWYGRVIAGNALTG
jgi:beta-glucosidase